MKSFLVAVVVVVVVDESTKLSSEIMLSVIVVLVGRVRCVVAECVLLVSNYFIHGASQGRREVSLLVGDDSALLYLTIR